MTTVTVAMAALERHCGFAGSRVRAHARRLQESGLMQLGAAGVAPAISKPEFVRLFLACAADRRVRESDEVARVYPMLTPGGVPIGQAPAGISTGGDALLALVASPRNDLGDVRIEVVANWPEIAIHWLDAIERFTATGAIAGHWQSRSHRRSATVQGVAFHDAVFEIFGAN